VFFFTCVYLYAVLRITRCPIWVFFPYGFRPSSTTSPLAGRRPRPRHCAAKKHALTPTGRTATRGAATTTTAHCALRGSHLAADVVAPAAFTTRAGSTLVPVLEADARIILANCLPALNNQEMRPLHQRKRAPLHPKTASPLAAQETTHFF
jgi:hypothetical protein